MEIIIAIVLIVLTVLFFLLRKDSKESEAREMPKEKKEEDGYGVGRLLEEVFELSFSVLLSANATGE